MTSGSADLRLRPSNTCCQVYYGQWRGLEVAVKVMSAEASQRTHIAQEVRPVALPGAQTPVHVRNSHSSECARLGVSGGAAHVRGSGGWADASSVP